MDTSRGYMEYEECVDGLEAANSPHFGREEVTGGESIPVRAKELGPGCLLCPFWGWLDTVVIQNLLDRVVSDRVANMLQRAFYSPVAPRGIIESHPND